MAKFIKDSLAIIAGTACVANILGTLAIGVIVLATTFNLALAAGIGLLAGGFFAGMAGMAVGIARIADWRNERRGDQASEANDFFSISSTKLATAAAICIGAGIAGSYTTSRVFPSFKDGSIPLKGPMALPPSVAKEAAERGTR